MNGSAPVFVADSCIGGLSVLRSLWRAGRACDATFLADYAINPLGVKSEADIAAVVADWLRRAAAQSDTLLIACNTLSLRYRQVFESAPPPGLRRVVSMVDCFEAMVRRETERLANRRVLVIGTEFTASQSLYPDILRTVPGVQVRTVAATALERAIARLEPKDLRDDSILTREVRNAISDAEVAVLACTCFPIITAELESLFPGVLFVDPGASCPDLLPQHDTVTHKSLQLEVSGSAVPAEQALAFARSWLDEGDVTCCT